jgi:hypothetical protein
MLHDIVTEIGKQYLYVLKAILIAAGVEYTVGLYTDGLALGHALLRYTAGKSVILHYISS